MAILSKGQEVSEVQEAEYEGAAELERVGGVWAKAERKLRNSYKMQKQKRMKTGRSRRNGSDSKGKRTNRNISAC